MTQGGEPEAGQVADRVAFLVERDGLPAGGQIGGVPDRVQEAQAEGGLSHAVRADEHRMRARAAKGLLADQAEHLLEGVLACDERGLQLVRGQLGRVVEPAAVHGATLPYESHGSLLHDRPSVIPDAIRAPLRGIRDVSTMEQMDDGVKMLDRRRPHRRPAGRGPLRPIRDREARPFGFGVAASATVGRSART